MKLSVVIVNYNVRYFLEQCLLSVQKAIKALPVEVYVVDNNSVDGSVDMVREKFDWVKVIANKENTGFSKANNQAMRIATGEYILLLNPDTLVQEDTFEKVVAFMDAHPDAGGLGVKMVDGKGVFLPESKRGLPTPETSFYKIFGISRLFARSKRINRYYLGHLSNDETNEIEILSGAFMLMRKAALDKVGLLDEAFFMYGEDIDLSWRIIQVGYKNYYFPETRIIHYKGESTKKGSLNYVFVFYNAMVIFARKHFSQQHAELFSFFINMAIWMRAGVAVVNRFVRSIALPVVDVMLTLASLFLITRWYAEANDKIYDPTLVNTAFISFAAVWCFSAWIGGAYDRPLKPQRIIKPMLVGTTIIIMAYSFLPEDLRFSRAILGIGAVAATLVFLLDRVLGNLITSGRTGLEKATGKRFAVVGSEQEIERVSTILAQTNYHISFTAKVSSTENVPASFVGSLHQLDEIVRVHSIDAVIFCAKDMASSDIISAMSSGENKEVEYKIAPPESLYIIGSNSIETSGDVFILDVNSIGKTENKRVKRFVDVMIALVLLSVLPLSIVIQKSPMAFIGDLFSVLLGRKSWVGFYPQNATSAKLPKIKPGVLFPSAHAKSTLNPEQIQKLNILYAKDYKWWNDVKVVVNKLREL